MSTLHGIIIDWSAESLNAIDSIRVNREFDSNKIDESDLQFKKHSEQRISGLGGIIIDWSDYDENADDWIQINRDFDSNKIHESDSQFENRINNNLKTPCNTHWLKWWTQRCRWCNSCQSWIWFKWNWCKWLAIWRTWWTEHFNTLCNNHWLKRSIWKSRWFHSCQWSIWLEWNW
jgi:hypothetical protein